VKRLPDDRRANRIFLKESLTRELGYTSSASRTDLVGVEGLALTDLRPSGTARFGSESVDVVSNGSFVKAGSPVRIVQAEGYRHVVEPV
jgi:membrane-bound serine protease (ClpP class)